MEPSTPPQRQTISAILIDAAAVTTDQVDLALDRHRETGCRIGQALVELGFVSEEDIGWALARQLGIPFIDVRLEMLDADLVRSFPEGALRRLQAVPLFTSEGRVTAAVADPTDHDAIQELERLCAAPASCVAATPSAIGRALDATLGPVHGAHARHTETAGPAGFAVIWERSGESFLKFQIAEALRLGTREIHFACANSWLHVQHRSATRLGTVSLEPAAVMDVLLARFESLGMKPLTDGDEHREFFAACPAADAEWSLRVSVLATSDGLSATVRLLGDPAERPRLDTLGIAPLELAQLRDVLHEPSGLVLVSGPDGSGRGATLAALLAEQPTDTGRWTVFTRDRRRWPAANGTIDVVTGPLSSRWARVVTAHSCDGIVLDGGLDGARVSAVLDGATHGRWTLARTDWDDTFALLDWLMQEPGGRAAIARRLRAVIQQRLVATSRDAAAGGPPLTPVAEVLIVTDRLRTAVLAGANGADLRAIAEADGFRSLTDHLKAGVADGRFDPRDSARAMA